MSLEIRPLVPPDRAVVDDLGAASLGSPYVVLEGDSDYYGGSGWQPASEYGATAPSARIPGAALQLVALPGREPWMTGRVVYRDVWWEFDATGLRDPVLAQLEMNLPD